MCQFHSVHLVVIIIYSYTKANVACSVKLLCMTVELLDYLSWLVALLWLVSSSSSSSSSSRGGSSSCGSSSVANRPLYRSTYLSETG